MSELNFEWDPFEPPKSQSEFDSRFTLSSALLEREPSRRDSAYFKFMYLNSLPETKGILEEKLIAVGPSYLLFSDKKMEATAFLTDNRLVHLALFKAGFAAIGEYHKNIQNFVKLQGLDVQVHYHSTRCPELAMAPRLTKNGLQNRFAMEWYNSYAKLVTEKV